MGRRKQPKRGAGKRAGVVGTVFAVAALGLTACRSTGSDAGSVANAAASVTSTSQPGSATTGAAGPSSTAAAHTAATAKPPPPGIGPGANGPEVLALEQKLDQLHYTVGKIDDHYDSLTSEGVIAFQKVNGMARTGRVTPEVEAAVAAASAPPPMIPDGGATRVEIDLKRQVLFFYENNALSKTVMISSGGGYRYCVKGACSKAITPGGSYRVGVKILGKHISPLGELYNPMFFNGGIAIHGEPAVPTYPASHGCVRVPMSISRWLYDRIGRGTPVYVFGGPNAPVPFNTPAPDGTPPQGPVDVPTADTGSSTTATNAPASTAPSTTSPSTTTTTTALPVTTTSTTPATSSTTATTAAP